MKTKTNISQILTSLLRDEFNVNETFQQVQFWGDFSIFCSWGVTMTQNLNNRALLLRVNGHHHKGLVLITYNGGADTYIVHIISNSGEVLDTYNDVYCDELQSRIDNRIERIEDYAF
jgi:hypothetical protein